ncbi:KaiC/GvpD/RAD55 family RecA-like ATPase [Labrenzia sp. EL_195]|nr:KaiC/GvpD/RAD55 family RecA-like ATPase [Labrenzia sp. EL_195]
MEIQRFIDSIRDQFANGKFELSDEDFFSTLLVGERSFINHEGDFWDFKESWPFSYSDGYFQSLVKLVVSFANNMGGLIIFNVADSEKIFKQSKVHPNPDRFMTACHDLINECPKLEFREFRQDELLIPVLIIFPKACHELPANLKTWKSRKRKHWFVREGYECVSATTKKIPTLFCRPQLRVSDDEVSNVESALPPSPLTLKHFVTRFDILERVFSWVHDDLQPRCFLFGRGGSGKTTIAYEIAKYIAKYNSSINIENNFDVVLFVSAKESELDILSGNKKKYIGTDFANKKELFEAILSLGGYYSSDEKGGKSTNELKDDLKDMFDYFNALIVVDDIDTITTKGDDAGLEELFLITARAKKIPKILYTLRNAPSYAHSNSIEVPGLTDEIEIQEFVNECATQFKVKFPSGEELSEILRVTEGRPLGIESVLALRRSTKSYEAAIRSFEEHAGDNARSYVFEREWNALSSNQRSHNLLVALALTGRALDADELVTILRYDEQSVQEAIVETMEMFLELEEGPSGTTYNLGEMTKRFVLSQAPNLKLFEQIKARVKTFKSRFHNKTPDIRKLIIEVDRILHFAKRDGDEIKFDRCWDIISNPMLPEKVKQNPHFMAYAGSVALKLPKPKIIEAREYFLDAHRNEHAIDIDYLEAWHRAECQTASSHEMCATILEIVLKGQGYREADRVRICSVESARLFFSGKETRIHNTERAIYFLTSSLILHMKNLYRADKCNHFDIDTVHRHARNTALLLFSELVFARDIVEFAALLKNLAEIDRAYFDPLVQPFKEYGMQICTSTTSMEKKGKAISALQKLKRRVTENDNWYEINYKNELEEKINVLIDCCK